MNQRTGTLQGRISIPNPEGQLRPGMFVGTDVTLGGGVANDGLINVEVSNFARASADATGRSSSSVVATGSIAMTDQGGVNNTSAIIQVGNNHDASVRQRGDNNITVVIQGGP